MGNASLGGRHFRLDPTSVQWSFDTKLSDKPTVGGKVMQVFGTRISDMTVQGTFGAGGWREQEKFLAWMKDLGDKQVADYGSPRSRKKPFRFIYPAKRWNFLVYLKAFSNLDGGSRSVVLAPEIFAPTWQLTLFIVEDNSGLKRVAQDAYISRLSEGLGWKQTVYNGPMDDEQLKAALEGSTIQDYILESFGIGQVAAGNQDPYAPGTEGGSGGAAGEGSTYSSGDGSPDSNRALGKKIAADYGWTGEQWNALERLWTGESGWNHQADNPSSSAYGIPQALIEYPGRVMPKGYYGTKTGSGSGAKFTGGDPAVQIRWGLNYIKSAYGNPANAYAKWLSRNPHWY